MRLRKVNVSSCISHRSAWAPECLATLFIMSSLSTPRRNGLGNSIPRRPLRKARKAAKELRPIAVESVCPLSYELFAGEQPADGMSRWGPRDEADIQLFRCSDPAEEIVRGD